MIRFIAVYLGSDSLDDDALDNDGDNDDGSGGKSYAEDAQFDAYAEDVQCDAHIEDSVVPFVEILLVEVLYSAALLLAFVDKYFLGSLYNSLHSEYSILCGYH